MTIAAQTNRTSITGNGLTTAIPIPFPFTNQTSLVVVETIIATGAQTVKALTTDYTVSGTQNAYGLYPNGGTVTMVTAPAATVTITVYREEPTTQDVHPVENDRLPVVASIENPFDKVTMILQRHRELINRSLHQPDGDSANMAALPAKVTRASRYFGFDGDGNPTMMQTPTGMVTSIAQLTESLVAGLPAAGAAGTLRKVTDSSRGVWMDTGTRWIALNRGEINALECLKGDGTDETTAFQAMLDTGKDVFFPRPPVAYAVAAGLTLSTNYQQLRGLGLGSLITCLGAGYNLFTPTQDLVGVEIHQLHFQGGATSDATAQYLLFTTSSFQVTFSKFMHLTITGPSAGTGFNNGILFDTASNDNAVAFCHFEHLIGTTAGHGYGVQLGNAHRNTIVANQFVGTTGEGRHGVYVGSGSSRNVLALNQIRGFNSSLLVVYALSSQAQSTANMLVNNILDDGTTVAPEAAAIEIAGNVADNLITGNVIDGFAPNGIIVSDSGQGGLCTRNTVRGNTIRNVGATDILVLGAKKTAVLGNDLADGSQTSSGTSNGITITSSGSFGTEVADETTVLGNTVRGSSHRFACSINSTSPVPTNTVMRGNDFRAGASGRVEINTLPVSGDDAIRYAATYGTSIPIVAYGALRTQATISVSDNVNFAIGSPSESVEGKELVITIRNATGGAIGTLTFHAVFKIGASWTQPATGKSRSIRFAYDGTNWIEVDRTAADVAT